MSGKSLHWCPPETQRQGKFVQSHTASHPSPPCLARSMLLEDHALMAGLLGKLWAAGDVLNRGAYHWRVQGALHVV